MLPELFCIRCTAAADPVCTLFAEDEPLVWPVSSTQTRREI